MLQCFEMLNSVKICILFSTVEFFEVGKFGPRIKEMLLWTKNGYSRNELSNIVNYRGHIPFGFEQV